MWCQGRWYTCNTGYHKNPNTLSLICTDTWSWYHDVLDVCTGNGNSSDCDARVDATCSGYTCYTGYHKNPNTSSLICTDTWSWYHDVLDLCTGNGNSSDCDARVDDTCSGYTCYTGYHKNPNTSSLICTDTWSWYHDVLDFCTGNGNSSDCDARVDDNCSGYTCNIGYHKNPPLMFWVYL